MMFLLYTYTRIVFKKLDMARIVRNSIILTGGNLGDFFVISHDIYQSMGAQWLSGRVLDSRPKATGSSLTSVNALCP